MTNTKINRLEELQALANKSNVIIYINNNIKATAEDIAKLIYDVLQNKTFITNIIKLKNVVFVETN